MATIWILIFCYQRFTIHPTKSIDEKYFSMVKLNRTNVLHIIVRGVKQMLKNEHILTLLDKLSEDELDTILEMLVPKTLNSSCSEEQI